MSKTSKTIKWCRVEPGAKVNLADYDSSHHEDLDKKAGLEEAAEHVAALDDLIYRLYAENRRSLLVVLQGMDTSGKDGTIRHVLSGVSPQTCEVASFKQPSAEELSHDFLWRIHRQAPPHGHVGIFNRSHYEDVLVVRVHKLVEPAVWKARYEQINAFERQLTEGGTTIVKIYLHIGRDEQRDRLRARLDDPDKYWKISQADVAERKYWDDYTRAYEDALSKCSTDYAPWYIVPADHKWFRNLAASRILRETLTQMDPKFPEPAPDVKKIVID